MYLHTYVFLSRLVQLGKKKKKIIMVKENNEWVGLGWLIRIEEKKKDKNKNKNTKNKIKNKM